MLDLLSISFVKFKNDLITLKYDLDDKEIKKMA